MRSPFLRDGSELKVPGNKASVSLVLPLCWWCILSGLWVWRNVFFYSRAGMLGGSGRSVHQRLCQACPVY